jgi:hypothetical protein
MMRTLLPCPCSYRTLSRSTITRGRPSVLPFFFALRSPAVTRSRIMCARVQRLRQASGRASSLAGCPSAFAASMPFIVRQYLRRGRSASPLTHRNDPMPRTYSSNDKIRAELAWVNETPDPTKCGCRHVRCCEETGHKCGECSRPVATKSSRLSDMPLRPLVATRWEA